jgi:hypothetical protein
MITKLLKGQEMMHLTEHLIQIGFSLSLLVNALLFIPQITSLHCEEPLLIRARERVRHSRQAKVMEE